MAAIPVDKEDVVSSGNFQELFARFYPGICRQLTAILGDPATAEDLAQETFLKLYCTPPREMVNIGGWLHKVAVNLAYKHLRREGNRRRRERDILNDPSTGVDDGPSLTRLQEIREVRETLSTLSPRDRLCLVLRFSGYSYREIAGFIGVDARSVGTILARARARFRAAYDHRGVDADVLR